MGGACALTLIKVLAPPPTHTHIRTRSASTKEPTSLSSVERTLIHVTCTCMWEERELKREVGVREGRGHTVLLFNVQ